MELQLTENNEFKHNLTKMNAKKYIVPCVCVGKQCLVVRFAKKHYAKHQR